MAMPTPPDPSATADDEADPDRIALYFHIHLVSDSTGETLMNAMKASVARFDHVIAIEHLYALVRSPRQMERVLKAIEEAPGVVMFTIVNDDLRRTLERRCAELNVPCIAVLDPILAALSRYLRAPMVLRTGAQHDLDSRYDQRIDALNFAMAHDDGQLVHELDEADVVLLGVSRTSKTPTCVYLAQRGVKAGNIPIVADRPLPEGFQNVTRPLIVGLTASADRLVQIRRNRLLSLRDDHESSYAQEESVREELLHAKRLFSRQDWPVIDVTRRSVEETAAKIINLLNDRDASDG